MTDTGVMVSTNLNVEPIVPLGMMAQRGCKIQWKGGKIKVFHPLRGELPVQVLSGCPQIPKTLAMELIQEFEQRQGRICAAKILLEQHPQKEMEWLQALVEGHPALQDLPSYVKEALLCEPGDWADLPANRHQRKRFKQKGGFLLHLYAGEKEGYTLQAAAEAQGLKGQLLEVDVKRGENHEMAAPEATAYRGLLRAALDGALLGVIGGPNCRSRSVLRHYPGPPPLRSWEHEWGLPTLTNDQARQCQEDDILLWRQVFLYLIADLVRKAKETRRGEKEQKELPERTIFLLEQPADPVDYKPECVSFWRTKGWEALKKAADLDLLHVNQGDFQPWKEGAPVKPTSLGTNLQLRLPAQRNPGAKGRGDG